MDISNGFVCLMGIGTVFIGLVCIVFLCMLMSFVCRKLEKPETTVQNVTAPQNASIENKQEMIAAVCAVIAEELGKDVNAIKVLSFKRV